MSTASPPPRPNAARVRRKEERPGELLDAALDLFTEQGYAATRVEQVARRAGVSKGTLFRYFPSKYELFKAVVRHNVAATLREGLAEMASFEGPAAEQLRRFLRLWWERYGSTRASAITKFAFNDVAGFPELQAFYQEEVIGPLRGAVRAMIERGIARGEFRAMDSVQATYAVFAPLSFMVLWRHSIGRAKLAPIPLDPDAFLALQAELLVRGFSVSSPSSTGTDS